MRPELLRRARRYQLGLSAGLLEPLIRTQRTLRPTDDVLLAVHNELMADCALDAAEYLPDFPGRVYITRFPGTTTRHLRRVQQVGYEWIDIGRARRRPWRLVALPDHMPFVFPKSEPKVYLSHGVGPSRIVRGIDYTYERSRIFWPDGSRVYSAMAAANSFEWENSAARIPEYAGRVRVVGNLKADRMRRLAAERARVRSRLGVGSRRLVAIMSTWGPEGNLRAHGHWLLPAVEALVAEGNMAFVVTVHTKLRTSDERHTRHLMEQLHALARNPGVHLLGPEDDHDLLLAATDAAISDHTSLAAIYWALDRPIVPVAVPTALLPAGTLSHWLQTTKHPVASAAELRAALLNLDRYALDGDYHPPVEHLGEAGTRLKQYFHDVLYPDNA